MFAKPDKPPDLPTSYRPISLLSYFSKICERLILKGIYPHIISKNVLLSSQFGFRAKHNTVHPVHRVIDAISTFLENKCYCIQWRIRRGDGAIAPPWAVFSTLFLYYKIGLKTDILFFLILLINYTLVMTYDHDLR